MSERSYFSLRYAIPGFTFILLVMAINYVPLSVILVRTGKNEVGAIFGAILTFLSLLSGSAIGFLISQVWWRVFQCKGAEYSFCPKSTQTLIKKYDLTRSKSRKDKQKVIIVHDFITHSARADEELKEIVSYIERRWDLYHIMSSELWTLIVGSVLGVIYRILSHFLLFEDPIPSVWDILGFLDNLLVKQRLDYLPTEFWILLIIFAHLIFLGCLLLKGRDWIRIQHDALSEVVIKKMHASKMKPEKLVEIFPEDYFRSDKRKQSEEKKEDG